MRYKGSQFVHDPWSLLTQNATQEEKKQQLCSQAATSAKQKWAVYEMPLCLSSGTSDYILQSEASNRTRFHKDSSERGTAILVY